MKSLLSCFTRAFLVQSAIELGACICIYLLHKVLLPAKTGFGCKYDYKLRLLRNMLLLIELLLFRSLHRSVALDLFMLVFACLKIIPNFMKIFLLKKAKPEFVLISSDEDDIDNGVARYRWLLGKNDSLNVGALRRIADHVKPDAFLLQGLSPIKTRTIIRNRSQSKVLVLKDGEVQKLTANDLLRKTTLYVEQEYLKRLGVIFQGSSLDETVKQCLDNHSVNWTELTCTELDQLRSIQELDAVLDLTCLNGHLYGSDKIKSADKVLKIASKYEVPVFVLSPIFCQDRATEVYARVYEVLAQQYETVKIVRLPSLLFDRVNLKEDMIQNWARLDDLMVYLNYAANITNKQIIELSDGEYFFNHDLKSLIEEIAGM